MNAIPEYDIGVVLVGLNARDYIIQCLQSLERAEWRNFTHATFYVDNGSTDGSLETVNEQFPGVKTIGNPGNVGYCKAANQGATAARCRYYLFLNDDTIVLDEAIAMLAEFLDREPKAGLVGSRLLYPDLSEQWSGRNFPSPLNAVFGRRSILHKLFPNAPPVRKYLYKDELSGDEPFKVDWVSAAAVMFRKDAFDAVGGFAEDYYYWHEVIVSHRIRKLGMETYLHPRSRIIHFEGKGSGHRPYSVRKFHIIDLHRGAYRMYCERYALSRAHPLRWIAALGLGTRAALLLLANRLSSLWHGAARERQHAQKSK